MAFEWLTRLWKGTQSEGRMAVGTVDSSINSYLGALDEHLATGQASVHQTAAVEFALGMVGRAFMLAETSPAIPALSPLTLSMIARQTIALGDAVFQVSVDPATGEHILLPVAEYEVFGDTDPATWIYRIERERPTGERVPRMVPAAGMLHVRYMPRATSPWSGVSPLVGAGVTASALARIENSLAYDAQPPTGLLMPLPDGASDKTMTGV